MFEPSINCLVRGGEQLFCSRRGAAFFFEPWTSCFDRTGDQLYCSVRGTNGFFERWLSCFVRAGYQLFFFFRTWYQLFCLNRVSAVLFEPSSSCFFSSRGTAVLFEPGSDILFETESSCFVRRREKKFYLLLIMMPDLQSCLFNFPERPSVFFLTYPFARSQLVRFTMPNALRGFLAVSRFQIVYFFHCVIYSQSHAEVPAFAITFAYLLSGIIFNSRIRKN